MRARSVATSLRSSATVASSCAMRVSCSSEDVSAPEETWTDPAGADSTAPDNKWAVEFWSANLTDKYYYQVAFDAPYQYGQIDSFLGAPRTFGVTARVKF